MKISFTERQTHQMFSNGEITKYPMQSVELLLAVRHSKMPTSTLAALKPQAQQSSDLPCISITSSHLPMHRIRQSFFTIYSWEKRKNKLQTCKVANIFLITWESW